MEVPERTEDALRELTALDLIYEKGLFPELAYMFKHALTQDVAYGSLLVQRRKDLHRLIGLAIEELYGDRLAEQYEALAHHFSKAEDWAKALDYLVQAAKKAAKAFAFREAITLYAQALEAASRLGEDVPVAATMSIRRAKSELHHAVADWEDSRVEAERLLGVARQVGDRATEGWALAQIGWAAFWAEDFDSGRTYARQAIETGEQAQALAAVAFGWQVRGTIDAVTGRLDESGDRFARALAISRSVGDIAVQSLVRYFEGNIKNWQGAYRESYELATEGARLAREHNLIVPFLRNLWTQGTALAGAGDYDQARILLEDGLAQAEKIGDDAYIPRFLNTLGWVHLECEDLDRGLELSRLAVERARKRRHATGVEQTAFTEINRGDAFIAKGDLAAAQEVLAEAHRLVKDASIFDWMRWRCAIHYYVSAGELWLARGEPVKARECADQSLETATRTQSRKYVAAAWRLKGEAEIARRQWDEAERWLREALGMAQAIGNPRQLWKTQAALGRFYDERRNPEAARRAYQAAREVIDGVKARLRHREFRASLEGAASIRQVYELGTPG
jgi:tetratricopeptide (TPR) repeat protein